MYLIFLLIVINIIVKAEEESNESKYIDLLPEKEKEEFLQRIARRILADVKTRDDRDKYDGEISEDELNTHHEFVQKIFKEESDNLRRNDVKEKDKGAMIEKNENPEDDLKVKSLETIKKSLNRDDEDKYIDLTLRRDKRNEKSTEISVEVQVDKLPDKQKTVDANSSKHVDITNENKEEFKETKVEESSTVGSIEPKIEESDSEDIRIKPSRRNSGNDTKNDTNPSQIVTIDISKLNIAQSYNSDAAPPENNIDENNTKQNESQFNDILTSPSPEKESVTVTKVTKETTPQEVNNELTTAKNYNLAEKHDSLDNSFENITTTETNSRKNLNNNLTEESKSIIKLETVNNTSVDDITLEEVSNERTVADVTQDSTKAEVEVTTTDNIEILNVTVLQNVKSEIGAITNKSLETTHTVKEPINNVSSIELKILPSNFTMTNNVNINGSSNDDVVKFVATTIKYDTNQNDTKIFSQGLYLNNQDNQKAKENVSGTKNVDASENKNIEKAILREYNVFEIPPGEPPFIKKEEHKKLTNKEQPYYVPVYNYEPNNAYFNAHNRLGPNYDSDKPPFMGRLNEKPVDDNVKLGANIESDYFFESKEKSNRKFRFRVSTKKPNSWIIPQTYTGLPFVISKPKNVDIYFNPDDYLDMDYYFDRMKRDKNKNKVPFPTSSNEDHPFQSIAGQDLKDHIRAVRNILWKQHHFGFIPHPTKEPKESIENELTETPAALNKTVRYFRSEINKEYPPNANKNIAIDYYFGRMQNDNVKKVGYIKQKNIPKDVYLKTEEIPSVNAMKDIKVIKFNNKQYINDDVISITPHVYLLNDLNQKPKKRFSNENEIENYIGHDRNRTKHGNQSLVDSIAEIAKLSDMADVFLNIETMMSMNIPITRKNNDNVDAYVKVLNDMIKKDDIALKRYDWLGTAVDVRAALTKLMELTEAWQDRAILDPADIELLNYTLFLHNSAKELMFKKESEKINKVLRKRMLLPRNKKKRKRILKEKGLLQRAWLLRKKKNGEINDFKELLYDLQYYLHDLHEAIKNIALVTKFKNQKWYDSLKKIYLTSDKRNMLEVILHLTTTRLFGLIEDSAQNGLEDDYIDYILKHDKEVRRSLEELMFVLKLLDELKRFEN